MYTRSQVAYFGAGPAPLPTPILEAGARAFVNYNDTGLSLAEISHRSAEATGILARTKTALTQVLDIPDNYEVLFMHGGGSGEFSAVVFNMVAHWVEKRKRRAMEDLGGDEAKVIERVRSEISEHLRLDYILTGSWSLKASQEAAQLLEPMGKDFVNIVVDARKGSGGKFDSIPETGWNLTPNSTDGKESAFVYYCDNETVDGVEFPRFPSQVDDASRGSSVQSLLVADMSSNFLSRKVNVDRYAVIFGGAQKNIGITDVTLVIVRKDVLAVQPSPAFLHAVGVWSPPVVFHWPTIAKNNSLYNTMPIFSIWIAGEVIRTLTETKKGLVGQEEISGQKAKLLYDTLDAYPAVFQVVPKREVRSRMNICFRVQKGDAAAEKRFLDGAEKRMLQGLKGHRSVGGIRASNYNAVPMENVRKLVEYMIDFAKD